MLYTVIPFAIIRRDRRIDLDFTVRQSIVLLAFLIQRDRDDDLIIIDTVRRFVFRRGGVVGR